MVRSVRSSQREKQRQTGNWRTGAWQTGERQAGKLAKLVVVDAAVIELGLDDVAELVGSLGLCRQLSLEPQATGEIEGGLVWQQEGERKCTERWPGPICQARLRGVWFGSRRASENARRGGQVLYVLH